MFRAGVRAALEEAGFRICAEADTTPTAIEAALAERPDLCLMDIDLPGGGGIDAAERISTALPEARVVLLTSAGDDNRLLDALRAGAWGYLPKRIPLDELETELQAVLAGEVALPRALTTRLVEEFRRRDRRRSGIVGNRKVRLTPREWEVLDLLAANSSTSEIAARLHVSPPTVRTHVAAILHKLDLHDRGDLQRLSDA